MMNEDISRILDEKDPLLREIWSAGYTHILVDNALNKIKLINGSIKYIKEISMDEWKNCIVTLSFKTGFNTDGIPHTWICEGDGSANKFRNLINKN